MEAELENVALIKRTFQRLIFPDNTSLLDDMTAVDRAIEEMKRDQQQQKQQKRTTTMTTVERHQHPLITTMAEPDIFAESDKESDIIYDRPEKSDQPPPKPIANIFDQAPSVRLLMVGDYSVYEKFLNLYGNDHSAAYKALRLYLEAIFDQVETIFSRINFFDRFPITLRLAAVTPIFRVQDCPLKAPILRDIHREWRRQRRKSERKFLLDANCTSTGKWRTNRNNTEFLLDGNITFAVINAISNKTDEVVGVATNATNNQMDSESDEEEGENLEEIARSFASNKQADWLFKRWRVPEMLRADWDHRDGLTAIHAIHDWARSLVGVLPPHEHVVVITRIDLLTPHRDSATQGMAYVRAMCRGADSASVVEDVGGLSTAAIVAHEIVHSLGAFHDGVATPQFVWGNDSIPVDAVTSFDNSTSANETSLNVTNVDGGAGCEAAGNFLMAPTSSGNEWNENFGNAFRLSECSRRAVENFLRSRDSQCLRRRKTFRFNGSHRGKKGNPSERLTFGLLDSRLSGLVSNRTPKLRTRPSATSSNPKRRRKPGELFDANQQCRIAFGAHYGLCRRRDFYAALAGHGRYQLPAASAAVDGCRRLWCKNRRLRRYAPCETKSFLPLMDGTRCANGKWCMSGECVPKWLASKNSAAVVDHDDDSCTDCRDLNPSYCTNLSTGRRSAFCATRTFVRICCALCAPFTSKTRTAEDHSAVWTGRYGRGGRHLSPAVVPWWQSRLLGRRWSSTRNGEL